MAATSQPLRRTTRLHPMVSQALLGGGLASLALLYWFPLRRWFRRWGTTPDERTRAMPGDDVITHPTHTAMQAVTVEAPPDALGDARHRADLQHRWRTGRHAHGGTGGLHHDAADAAGGETLRLKERGSNLTRKEMRSALRVRSSAPLPMTSASRCPALPPTS